MTEQDFISFVSDELTVSGSLPAVLNENEIKRIIVNAKGYFYESYYEGLELQHYIIRKETFETPEFKKTRSIVLPDMIYKVTDFRELKNFGTIGTMDRDFGVGKLLASEIFMSSFIGDDLVMMVANQQFFDLTKAFYIQTVSYDFNAHTHKLKVLGRDPQFDMYLMAGIKMPDESLFSNYYFRRYCVAMAKISFARVLGLYQFPLIGGVQLNPDLFRQEGETELAEIKEKMMTLDTPDWFLQYNL